MILTESAVLCILSNDKEHDHQNEEQLSEHGCYANKEANKQLAGFSTENNRSSHGCKANNQEHRPDRGEACTLLAIRVLVICCCNRDGNDDLNNCEYLSLI